MRWVVVLLMLSALGCTRLPPECPNTWHATPPPCAGYHVQEP